MYKTIPSDIKTICLFTPRVHPNLVYLAEFLKDHHIRLNLYCWERSGHSAGLSFLRINPSILECDRLIDDFFKDQPADTTTLYVVRDVTSRTYRLLRYFHKQQMPHFLYDQNESLIFCTPINLLRESSRLLKYLITLRHIPFRLSPSTFFSPSLLEKSPKNKYKTLLFRYPLNSDSLSHIKPHPWDQRRPGKIISCVAKMWLPRKNVGFLLDSLPNVYNLSRLVLVGELYPNSNREYTELISRKLGILESLGVSVSVVSNQSHSATLSLIKSTDLFVLPSNDETFAVSPLEACMMGIPTIYPRSGSAWLLHTQPHCHELPPTVQGLSALINKILSLGPSH